MITIQIRAYYNVSLDVNSRIYLVEFYEAPSIHGLAANKIFNDVFHCLDRTAMHWIEIIL